jgi:hypothetical protein
MSDLREDGKAATESRQSDLKEGKEEAAEGCVPRDLF